jgi:1-acyl-sn-glycerol-3-phosphate acyltransferase
VDSSAHGGLYSRYRGARVRMLRGLDNALFAVLTRREVVGLEHIPTSGPCLLVFNHLSNLDPPLIFGVIKRLDLTALVAAEYQARWFHRLMIEGAGGRWIRRGASDRAALKEALTILERGWMIGIAPEGGRSPAHALRRSKTGAAFLAHHANVPILPVGVTGTEAVTDSLKRFRRQRLSVRFGPLFTLPPVVPGNHKQQLEQSTDLIMCHIAALIPPQYRGIYGDHLLLPALLMGVEGEASMATSSHE